MHTRTLLSLFAAILLAVLAGMVTGKEASLWGITAYQVYGLIGQLFLNALSLVVVPLVASSIITGAARMGGDSFRGLGTKTFGFYILLTTLAVCVGSLVMILVEPGVGAPPPQAIEMDLVSQQQAIFPKIEQLFFRLVPSNIIAVAAQGQMLGLILFCLIFGAMIPRIDPFLGTSLLNFWQAIFQVMMRMTHLVMRLLPIGVFGLVAKVVASTGSDAIKPLALFFGTVLLALSLFSFIVVPLLIKLWAKVSPLRFFKELSPALLTAFTTSSSSSALPIVLETMEHRVGIPNRICSFTIPLGASICMSGTALYIAAVVIFTAQVYGAALDSASLILIALMAILTSFGMAGIPSASLVTIVMILQTVGLPTEGVALVLPVERILDMCRTVVNVISNTSSTVLVARSEGETLAITPLA